MKLQQLTLWQSLRSKQSLLLAGTALCAALLGWYLGNMMLLQQQQLLNTEVAALQQQLRQKEQALAAQIKQSDYLSAELAVERNTIALQQQDLKSEQQKLFDTRKELAFYQKIISPDLQANSLIIESFSLTKGSAVGSYKFNLVLIEQDKQKNFAKGQISLTLQGKKQGKNTLIDLLKLAGFAKAGLHASQVLDLQRDMLHDMGGPGAFLQALQKTAAHARAAFVFDQARQPAG